MRCEACVAAARIAVGAPFRLHGRSLATGLDCVGLVAFATGKTDFAPTGYALRTSLVGQWITLLDRLFVRREGHDPKPADIMLMQAGPAQIHLGIWTGASLIHADAVLRRVVETPAKPKWPVLGLWHI